MLATPAVFKSIGRAGFTLIEMSIVLVIIGLIIGGVLVGQDLISAALIRAQMSQIEKYQTAVNTFKGKYGFLPGDIPEPYASQQGLAPRGTQPGEGDGNGIIESYNMGTSPTTGTAPGTGENGMFWVDLTGGVGGGLIEGSFNTANWAYPPNPSIATGSAINQYFPAAKLGNGNYIYVTSGGWGGPSGVGDGKTYFTVSTVPLLEVGQVFPFNYPSYTPAVLAGMTVIQAYNIDKKMDDGLPQSGRAIAFGPVSWASGGSGFPAGASDPTTFGPVVSGDGVATPGSSTTCYDNGNVAGATEAYSTEISNGANLNCVLSFRFQ